MQRALAVVLAVLFAVCCRAQERPVRVQLTDGETVVGTVVAMDLKTLEVRVDGGVRAIDAARIAKCWFDEAAEGTAPPGSGAAPSTATPPASAGSAADTVAPPATERRVPWQGPLPDPVDTTAADTLPHDVRGRSRLRSRLELLDERYPWLVPSQPSQWLSVGLLLAALASFTVYHSVRIAGAEGASFGRGIMVAGWYLFSAALQVAVVPWNDFAIVLMLLANPTIALFWLSSLFGMTRLGASIAFAIQLGVGVLVFGVLELVTAVLGSIGAPIS
jgi:hypothetical protein